MLAIRLDQPLPKETIVKIIYLIMVQRELGQKARVILLLRRPNALRYFFLICVLFCSEEKIKYRRA